VRVLLLGEPLRVRVRVSGLDRGVYLRMGTTDIDAFEKVFRYRDYETSAISNPSVVVDAGAYTGLSPVWFAMTYPEAVVLALEPSSANYSMLQKNCSGFSNIRCVKVAVWHEDTGLILSDPGSGHWGYRVAGVVPRGEVPFERVEAKTLNSIMREHGLEHIDLLKVDIEGSERQVFEDSRLWIGKVNAIAIECHDWIQAGCTEAVEQAAADFPIQFTKGENRFFIRRFSKEAKN
jgi:FkbM family methyltransferase